MYPSVIEEIKVGVLHKITLRIPVDKKYISVYSVTGSQIHVKLSQIQQYHKKCDELLLGAVVQELDASWRERLQGQCVVDSDGDPGWHSGILTDQIAYLGLKGKMSTFVLCHIHPVHPLKEHRHLLSRSSIIFSPKSRLVLGLER